MKPLLTSSKKDAVYGSAAKMGRASAMASDDSAPMIRSLWKPGGKQLRRAEPRQYALNRGKEEDEGGSDCADDKPTAEYGLPQAGANGSFHGFALSFP